MQARQQPRRFAWRTALNQSRGVLILGLVLLAFLCFSRALESPGLVSASARGTAVNPVLPAHNDYVGDAACSTCHQQLSSGYAHTAHHLTSQAPSASSILGRFEAGSNIMSTANTRLTFAMEHTQEDVFTETARYVKPDGEVQQMTEPMDLVVGSGRRGQTYLWWGADQLFELPVSYWQGNKSWINSPGYRDGAAHFDRPILPQCLECHATSFVSTAPPANRFHRDSLVLGIGCERCHGPGAEHVRREQASPKPVLGSAEEAIVNPARLARERQIDICALCHSGPGEALAPSLSFQPGDTLADFIHTPPTPPDTIPDVHTNQVQLLRESKCFRSSAMTCTTCHNVHVTQRDAAAYSAKCLTCHRVAQCGEFKVEHAAIRGRCVDCHMPVQQSRTLFSDNLGGRLAPSIRSHRIAIYPANGDVH